MSLKVPETFSKEMDAGQLNRLIQVVERSQQQLDENAEISRKLVVGVRDLLIYKNQAAAELERASMLKWPLAAIGVVSGLLLEDVYEWLRSDAAIGAWVDLPAFPITALLVIVLLAGVTVPLIWRHTRPYAVTAIDTEAFFGNHKQSGGPGGSSGSGGGSQGGASEIPVAELQSPNETPVRSVSSELDILVEEMRKGGVPVAYVETDSRKLRRRQDPIGRRLRKMYADVISEEMAVEFQELLEPDDHSRTSKALEPANHEPARTSKLQ